MDDGVSGRRAPTLPWFLVGFLVAAGARSTDTIPTIVLTVANDLTDDGPLHGQACPGSGSDSG